MLLKTILCNLFLSFFLCQSVFAISLGGNGYDTGKLSAKDITVDTSTFSLNLSSLDSNVQHALQTLDQLITGASATPGGSNKAIQFNDSGAFGGFGSWDKTLYNLFIPGTQGTSSTFNTSNNAVSTFTTLSNTNSISVSPNGQKIALISYQHDSSVFIYDVATQQLANPILLSAPIQEGHVPMVWRDDSAILYIGANTDIDEINISTNTLNPRHGYSDFVAALLYHAGYLYVARYNNGIVKVDVSDFSTVGTIVGAAQQTVDMANTPSWGKIYCASPTGSGATATVIDVATFTILTTIATTNHNIFYVKVTPNGTYAIFTNDSGDIDKIATASDTLVGTVATGFANSVKSTEIDNTYLWVFRDNNTVTPVTISSMIVGSPISLGVFPYDTWNYGGLIYIATDSVGANNASFYLNNAAGDDGSHAALQVYGDIHIPAWARYKQGNATLITSPLSSDLDINNFNVIHINELHDGSNIKFLAPYNLYNQTGDTMMYWGNNNIEMFPPGQVNMGKLSINGSLGSSTGQGTLAVSGGIDDNISNTIVLGGHAYNSTATDGFGNTYEGSGYSFVGGYGQMYAQYSFCWNSTCYGHQSFAILDGKTYGTNSLATRQGVSNTYYGWADGYGNIANAPYQTVLGLHNVPFGNPSGGSEPADDDIYFMIGNGFGNGSSRSNVIEIKRVGDTLINGVLETGKRYTVDTPTTPIHSVNQITFTLNSGDPYFTANGTSRTFTIYAYRITPSAAPVYENVGFVSTASDANDAQGYQVDLAFTPSWTADGYFIYDTASNQYIDIGNPSLDTYGNCVYTLVGSTVMTPGTPTLSPLIVYSGDSANFPSRVNFASDGSSPVDSVTPAGMYKIGINGADAWVYYYQ